MLNPYQKQFLQNFLSHRVRFVVIGGMARFHYHDIPTRDLDVLVDIGATRLATEHALLAWATRYPAHTLRDMTPPLALRPMVQVKFPDDVCLYMDEGGEIREIAPEDGVDILTTIPVGDFDDLYLRSKVVMLSGLVLRMLSHEDLENTDRLLDDRTKMKP